MELQIGCFEYSMELENGKLSSTLHLSTKPSKTQRVYVLHERTGEAPAEVTRVTSKIMEACFKPQEGWLNAEKRVASRHVGSLMFLAYNTFFHDRVHLRSLDFCRAPTAEETRLASLIIYNYRLLTSSVSRRDRVTYIPRPWRRNNIG